jgi:hypothetical protein
LAETGRARRHDVVAAQRDTSAFAKATARLAAVRSSEGLENMCFCETNRIGISANRAAICRYAIGCVNGCENMNPVRLEENTHLYGRARTDNGQNGRCGHDGRNTPTERRDYNARGVERNGASLLCDDAIEHKWPDMATLYISAKRTHRFLPGFFMQLARHEWVAMECYRGFRWVRFGKRTHRRGLFGGSRVKTNPNWAVIDGWRGGGNPHSFLLVGVRLVCRTSGSL